MLYVVAIVQSNKSHSHSDTLARTVTNPWLTWAVDYGFYWIGQANTLFTICVYPLHSHLPLIVGLPTILDPLLDQGE